MEKASEAAAEMMSHVAVDPLRTEDNDGAEEEKEGGRHLRRTRARCVRRLRVGPYCGGVALLLHPN